MKEVVISDSIFDAPTDNYEEFDQEINPEKLGAKLIQTNPLRGSLRKFQFYANHYLFLNLIKEKRAPEKKYRINLAWLSAEPVHYKIIVWKWLYITLCCGCATGISTYLAIEQILKPQYGYIAATILFTLTLIFSLIFVHCKRDEYCFKSCFAEVGIFIIENKKPNLQKFNSFYHKIQQVIVKSQTELPVADRLVGELKMCRRLKDEGVINDKAYTIARTAIFKHDQYKS